MKKLFIVLGLFLLVTSCGNSELNNLDINKASQAIEKTLSSMQEIKKSTLEDTYDLDFDDIKSYVIKQNDNGDLYAIIETTNKEEVKEDMNEYFAKVKEFNTAYSPERLEILENRVEKEVGNYLIYIVAENADAIYNDVLDTIE